jgi:uncharacterized protein YcbK (DUF882 family)
MMIDSKRRLFLAQAAASSLSLGLAPSFAWAAADDSAFWAQPRQLRLYRPQTGEAVNEVYWADGRARDEGYLRICQLMRDPHAGVSVYMDPRLLDLMRAVQGYMEFYGFKNPLLIHSGYRSPSTNAKTEGAARNSMHLHGKAVDFTMPGVPSNYMGALASHYQAGGVGFYPGAGFSHMDTGNVRYWSEASLRPRR